MMELAKAIAPKCKTEIIGIRPGEKLHEVMLTAEESFDAVKRDKFYIICPSEGNWDREQYCKKTDAVAVEDGYEYDSGSNDVWLSVEQIEKLIETEQII